MHVGSFFCNGLCISGVYIHVYIECLKQLLSKNTKSEKGSGLCPLFSGQADQMNKSSLLPCSGGQACGFIFMSKSIRLRWVVILQKFITTRQRETERERKRERQRERDRERERERERDRCLFIRMSYDLPQKNDYF